MTWVQPNRRWVIKLRAERGQYQPGNVFNMDESGLFYRAIPSHTYLLNDGDVRQVGRGLKAFVASPDPKYAAADGLRHCYANIRVAGM